MNDETNENERNGPENSGKIREHNSDKTENGRNAILKSQRPDNGQTNMGFDKIENGFRLSNGNMSHADNVSVQTDFTAPSDPVTDVGSGFNAVTHVSGQDKLETVEIEDPYAKYMLYSVLDSPPIHVTAVCALQVSQIYVLVIAEQPRSSFTEQLIL